MAAMTEGRARFTVGGAIGKSLKVWIASLPHLFLASLLVFGPLFVIEWLVLRNAPPVPVGEAPFGTRAQLLAILFPLIEALSGFVIQGVVVMMVFQKLRGEPLDLFRSLSVGVARLPALLGIAIVVAFATFAIVLPGALLAIWVSPILEVTMVVAIVPFLVWYVASPAAIVERIGVGAALKRSAALTKGDRPRIFGTLVVVVLLFGVVGAIFGAFIGTDSIWFRAFGAILNSTLSCVLSVVIYHDLREAKEGIGIESLAAIFD
jgi:hypothetical protein